VRLSGDRTTRTCVRGSVLGALTLCLALALAPATPALAAAATPAAYCSAQRASAAGSTLLSVGQARVLAGRFLLGVRASGPFADWVPAVLDAGTPAEDLDGHPAVYVFRVSSRAGAYLGYVTIDAVPGPNPVLEFSRNDSPVFTSISQAQAAMSAGRRAGSAQRQLYLGPMQYAVEAASPALGATTIAPTRELMGFTSGNTSRGPPAVPAAGPAPFAASGLAAAAGPAAALGTSYWVIAGVPDYDQFSYDYSATEYNSGTTPAATGLYAITPYLDLPSGAYYSGCVPTAAANMVKYWADHGYPLLDRGVLPAYAPAYDPDSPSPSSPVRATRQKMVNDLHVYFRTYGQGGSGWTYTSDARAGLVKYASEIGGYAFTADLIYDFSWNQYVGEISENHPVLLGFSGLEVYSPNHFSYGDHGVTGIGYDYTGGVTSSEYMIIHDNWKDAPADVYVQFAGSNATYATREMVAFHPTANAPSNDMFASPTAISGSSGSVTGSNAFATKETGEPPHAGKDGGASVWFRWTPASSGAVTFTTAGSSFDTLLAVYTGSSVGALTEVASNDDVPEVTTSQVTFTAVAGTTYRIAVDGWAGDTGTYVLGWESASHSVSGSVLTSAGAGVSGVAVSCSGGSATTGAGGTFTIDGLADGSYTLTPSKSGYRFSPATRSVTLSGSNVSGQDFTGSVYAINDAFASATVLTGSSGSAAGSTVNATKEAGEPLHAGNAGGASVWFDWTAPQSGTVRFTTAGSSFDTLLAVYTGSVVGALTSAASNDDTAGLHTSAITFTAHGGTTYHIAIDGWGGATGTYALSWATVRSVSGSVLTSAGAGIPGVLVSCSGGSATTGGDGAFTIDGLADGSYTLTPSKAGYYFTPATRAVTVSGASLTGQGFTGSTVASNDAFASATVLSDPAGTVSGSTALATTETGEPAYPAGVAGGASVWFSWTAPRSGTVRFTTAGSSFDTLLAVYTGSAIGALTKVAFNDDSAPPTVRTSLVTFTAVAGTTYRIVVDGYGGATGTYTLAWVPVPTAALTTPALSTSKPRHNTYFTITGYVTPRVTGTVRVYLYRKVRGRYVTYPHTGHYASPAVTVSGSRGRYTYRVRVPYAGGWRVRSYYAGGSQATAGWSAFRYFTVR
jgi:hypothetical protein